ncbi:DUF2911 domain-containing protein [Flaviaesturariibacter amylovorans]|uniref:DUF2911 domain-containing protein n=1 Tax=Flaviaesturariibacter amylovorans TaxID=1084520 RepID=A0ABP8HPH2_9BACT
MKTAAALCGLILLMAACTNERAPGVPASDSLVQRDTAPLPKSVFANRLSPVDLSPMDVSYYPIDHPQVRASGQAPDVPLARVLYSRPHKGGRALFGALLRYNEPWRLGANEATELELFSPATIQGVRVPAGRYVLYCIPTPTEWTIVFNKGLYAWGLKFDPAKDVHRFPIPVQKAPEPFEFFTMVFEPVNDGAELVMAWDDVLTRLPFKF